MPWKRFLSTVFTALVLSGQGHAAESGRKTLCFFSLNNAREYELTGTFLEQSRATGQLRALEFHHRDRDDRPESSFRSMLESGVVCDGLVISGHHTGSFGGNRANGVLNISFLEELSCDPHYEQFFRQVQAVWLQGCRTLGTGPLAGNEEQELQADYHMQRVGAELIQDGLEQSFTDLSIEFSATLDQDNPLATRYQRVFPAATVFGWTRSSPGIKSRSEKSMLYHMSHMAHVSRGAALVNPLRPLPPEYRSMMTDSMYNTLAGDRGSSELARQAWISHGKVRQAGLGYDNPDLNAYPPLLQSSRSDLLEARALACELRGSSQPGALQVAVAQILANPDYLAYNLNALWDVFIRTKTLDPAAYQALKEQMAGSTALMNLLQNKLASPQTGLSMKIEYYSFYRELTGNSIAEVEALILQSVQHFMLARDLAGSAYDIRDFRESLLISVARHQLANDAFYQRLIHSPDTRSDTLYALSWSFVREAPPQAEALIREIIGHPAADSGALRGAALWVMTHQPDDTAGILASILAHPQADELTLETVAAALVKYPLEDNPALVAAIVTNPRTNPTALNRATLAVRKHGAGSDPQLIEEIIAHPSLDQHGLQNVARAIGNDAALADAELLQAIASHPQADERTLRYVDRARARKRKPAPENEFY